METRPLASPRRAAQPLRHTEIRAKGRRNSLTAATLQLTQPAFSPHALQAANCTVTFLFRACTGALLHLSCPCENQLLAKLRKHQRHQKAPAAQAAGAFLLISVTRARRLPARRGRASAPAPSLTLGKVLVGAHRIGGPRITRDFFKVSS